LESEQYSRKHYNRIKKECDQMEDELEALQKSSGQRDEEIERQLEQAKSDCQNLQEQLGKYQRQSEESRAFAKQVTVLEVEGREWKQKYHDLSERLKVEYDARLARSSRELKRLQAENERLRSEGRTQATSSMAGDWVSNASEAAAYSLRLQRDKLKMDLEKETTKLDKSQKKAMWLEHENKKYQKRTHELEEQVISLKRELNSKGRVGYVTEVSSKVAKEDSGREMSELRPLRHLNRDMTADKSEERLECTGQAMMTESSLKPDAENKCATQ
jgi:chromosome segregation ATPase